MSECKLRIAQCIEAHPVLNEKEEYRVKYLNVLQYFVERYSKHDIYAQEGLRLYKEKILRGAQYEYSVCDIKKAAKGAIGTKFKGFKLFSYRYLLLVDCLFLNAFNQKDRAEVILKEIKEIYHPRYHKKIELLFKGLYVDNDVLSAYKGMEYQFDCWIKNKKFIETQSKNILIVANMSAGKSTLINALIGKKINRTKNDACTAKVHYIYNKPYEDGYSYELDGELSLNADLDALMCDNPANRNDFIEVSTFFRVGTELTKRVCIVDTPGVNSFLDTEHHDLSYDIIANENYEVLVCVLNASNIGTNDDKTLIKYLIQFSKEKKIVFVVNQLDRFDEEEDSIEECLNNVQHDISSLGYENICICPVSGYAGVLAKKYIHNEILTEVEKMELQIFIMKFQKYYEAMKKYFVQSSEYVGFSEHEDTLKEKCYRLLEMAGILNLEKVLFD